MNNVGKTSIGLIVMVSQLAVAGGAASIQSNGAQTNKPKDQPKLKKDKTHKVAPDGVRVRQIEAAHLKQASPDFQKKDWEVGRETQVVTCEQIDKLRAEHNHALTMTTKALTRRLSSRNLVRPAAQEQGTIEPFGWIQEEIENKTSAEERERVKALQKQSAIAAAALDRLTQKQS